MRLIIHLQVLLKDGDYFCFDDIIVKIKELPNPEREMMKEVNKRSAIHSYNTRSWENLVVPFCRTATAQRSFSYRAITAWNSLISEETRNSATLSVFKRAVKREIYNSP